LIARMDNDWLNLAIQAFHNNDLTRARELLWGYVNYYRRDARGWLWYSRVQTRREDQLACLQRALMLAPNDPTILEEWERVTGQGFGDKSRTRVRALERHTARPVSRASLFPVRHAPLKPWKTMFLCLQFCLFVGALVLFLVALFSALPMFFGYRTLIVLSGSMEPTIPTGGIVLAQPVPSRSLQIGDIIVYSPGSESQIPIVHRIVSISERRGTRYYTTRGDANPNIDVAEVALPATAWRVAFSVPWVGYIISFAASPLGILLLIVLPLMGLVILTAWDWLRQRPAPRAVPVYASRSLSSRTR